MGLAQFAEESFAVLERDGEGWIDLPSRDPAAYAVRCVGDATSPRLKHGEFVLIEPGVTVAPGDEVLLQDKSGNLMLRVFLYRREGRLYVHSINNESVTGSIPESDLAQMHYVAVVAIKPSKFRPK